MNIQTIAQNLRNTISGKEKLLAEYESALSNGINSNPVWIATSTTKEFLEINIDDLKKILADIEQCSPSLPGEGSNVDWLTNPDRSGGQFTQDEINNASAWR